MKRLSLIAASLLIALTSCIREESPEQEVVLGAYSVTTVNATDVEEADTKSILTVDPCEIETLQVFAFDPTTEDILIYGPGAGIVLEGNPVTAYVEGVSSFEWCLPVGVELDIYAVANIGRIDVPASVSELLAMDAMMLTFDSLEELNALKAVPMHGILEGAVDTGDGNELVIRMKKVLARYDVSIAFEDFPEGTKVDRLTVRNAHRHATLFRSGEAAMSADEMSSEMDYTTEEDLAGLNAGGAITLYLPENMQTAVNGATSGAEKWYEISDENSTAMEFCTFMEITFSCEDIVFNRILYFGKHPTQNFDVERNLKTNVRVKLTNEIPPKHVLRFTSDYEAVPGETLSVGFTYDALIYQPVQSDFIVTGGLQIVSFDVLYDTGTVGVKVSESIEIDSDEFVDWISPFDHWPDQSASVFVDVTPVLAGIFFADASLTHSSDYFMPYDVYGRYSDGSVAVVSDRCSFATTNADAALFAKPYEVSVPVASYYISSTNISYGIFFGEEPGTAKITASCDGLSASLNVTNTIRAKLQPVGSLPVRDVFVRNAEPALVLKIGTEYGYPVKDLYPNSDRILPPMMLKFPDNYDSSDSAGSYATDFDFESSETIFGQYPTTLTITAGNRLEVLEVDVLGLESCVTGSSIAGLYHDTLTKTVTQLGQEVTKTGGYRKMFTLRVHVNVPKSDLGTLKKLEVSGPELVLDADQAIYSAFGTFEKDGVEKVYELTSDGMWTSSAFETSAGCGVFTGAKYSPNMQEVKFSFNGYTASLPVNIYRYSKFRHEFGLADASVYEVSGFYMNALYYPEVSVFRHKPRAFTRVHELKVIEEFYDVDDVLKDSRERSYYYDYFIRDSRIRTVGLGLINYYFEETCTSTYDASLASENGFEVVVNSSSSYQKGGSLYPDKTVYGFTAESDDYRWRRDDQSWDDALSFRYKKVN